MAPIYGIPPVSDADARILILGSMPGRLSLQAEQYYAHPRNLFWKIMAELLGFDVDAAYDNKLHILRSHNIALWDVMKSCTRNSSLDSDIVKSSIIINDFHDFFDRHPHVKAIFFNGAASAQTFAKKADASLLKKTKPMHQRRLPSTSPANASINYENKLAAWQTIIRWRQATHTGLGHGGGQPASR